MNDNKDNKIPLDKSTAQLEAPRGDAWCTHHASNQIDRGGLGLKH